MSGFCEDLLCGCQVYGPQGLGKLANGGHPRKLLASLEDLNPISSQVQYESPSFMSMPGMFILKSMRTLTGQKQAKY